MTKDLVSVVVPIYNVEKYLDRCIDSIVNQTYTNLEILLIDDGSPDRCPQMCDEWAKKDHRIRVIHKQNEGLGFARNTGIEQSQGEYICFFDSDDYIAGDLIEKAYQKICQERSDIVLYGCVRSYPEKDEYIWNIPFSEQDSYEGTDVVNVFLPAFISVNAEDGKVRNVPRAAWAAFYRMDLIRRTGWRFASERTIMSEDIYSHLILYKDVRKVSVLAESLYYYCCNSESLSKSYRPDRYEGIKHFYEKCLEVCETYRYPEIVKRSCMEPFMAFSIAALKQEAAFAEKPANGIRRIVNDPVFRQVLGAKMHGETNRKKIILFFAIQNKLYLMIRLLLNAQNRIRQG